MCLYINKSDYQVRIAEENIVCYKLIQKYSQLSNYEQKIVTSMHQSKSESLKDSYFSPYKFDLVVFNKTLTAKGEFKFSKCPFRFYSAFYNAIVIGSGAYHSFISNRHPITTWKYKIVECIIPKGSKYIIGLDGHGCKCYGSEKIIYKEICS